MWTICAALRASPLYATSALVLHRLCAVDKRCHASTTRLAALITPAVAEPGRGTVPAWVAALGKLTALRSLIAGCGGR
jgi:hypothetical protein